MNRRTEYEIEILEGYEVCELCQYKDENCNENAPCTILSNIDLIDVDLYLEKRGRNMLDEIYKVLEATPKTQRQIVGELWERGIKLEPRGLRKHLRKLNKEFIYGKIDKVVIADRNGSYLSDNEQDINRFIEENIRNAKSKLWTMYNIKKRMTKNKNMSFRDFINEHISEEEIDDE